MQVIMGPRQIGKTTLVGQLVKQTTLLTHYVAADGVRAANTAWVAQQ